MSLLPKIQGKRLPNLQDVATSSVPSNLISGFRTFGVYPLNQSAIKISTNLSPGNPCHGVNPSLNLSDINSSSRNPSDGKSSSHNTSDGNSFSCNPSDGDFIYPKSSDADLQKNKNACFKSAMKNVIISTQMKTMFGGLNYTIHNFYQMRFLMISQY